MTKIQPCLVPCKGVLADLHAVVSPNNSDYIQVFWGTSVLQVIPRNKNSVIFRISAGLLAMLKFKMNSICDVFGISEKTLREWRDALTCGDWDDLSEIFHGPGMPKKLSSDVEAYVRGRYREATDNGSKSTPHGFRKKLLEEVSGYWGIETNEETLRQVFRDEDKRLDARDEGTESTASQDEEDPLETKSQDDISNPNNDCTASNPVMPGSLTTTSDPATMEKVDTNIDTDAITEKREEPCAIENNSSPASDETHNLSPVSGIKLATHPESLADNLATENPMQMSEQEENCENPVNSSSVPAEGASDTGALTSTALPATREKFPCCLAQSSSLLWTNLPDQPLISQHAGLVILSSWFDRTFSGQPPIISQTAAQLLCGAVNPEQSKLIDYIGLEAFLGEVRCDIDYQHRLLSAHSNWETTFNVYRSNAQLLNLQKHRIFYFDPHHEKYTGIENVLLGWNGCTHCMCKGIMLDFIHTEWGSPCFVGHFDTFYDCRQRFLILRGRFMELFPADSKGFIWIQDRGFWGLDFLGQIAESEDYFIQWEKYYKKSRWDEPFLKGGRFSMRRYRNNRKDRRRYRFQWKEQRWDAFPDGRRIIVRARHPNGKTIEVSIVTIHPTMAAQKIIRLMFNRWLQESDFAYLNRHFGINELTGRLFETYQQIADDLDDRQIESRAHKTMQAAKKNLMAKIGRLLVHLHGKERISIDGLNAEREKLREKVQELSQKLKKVELRDYTDKTLHPIGQQIQQLKAKLLKNKKNQKQEQDFQEKEEEIKKLSQELGCTNQQLSQLSKTESRILALIEEGRVRPDMRKKALVDAVRITSRNVFRQAFDIFRPIYNNHRDDHVVLRALTRSSGIIISYADRIDVYLTPQLQREPAEWERIRRFLDICECRIADHFPLPVRILTRKSSAEIFHAVTRARHDHR